MPSCGVLSKGYEFFMKYDLQKASLLKRASAWILDMILLLVLVTGIAAVISPLLHFDSHTKAVAERQSHYESQYAVKLEITQEEYEKLPPAQKEVLEEAYKAFAEDKQANYHYNMIVSLSMVILSLSVLLGFLGLEFAVPMLFGNGQTVGKRVFGIAVMKQNGVQVNAVTMFVRTVLGKFTIEIMIPVYVAHMIFFGVTGLGGTLFLGALLVAQILIMALNHNNSLIHDLLAGTVVVDVASQMIFRDTQDLIDYKKRISREQSNRQTY